MELDAAQQRVLGCLVEKRRTTPDTYPLSLNALRTACNQSTNREPIMALTDEDVREAATGLHRHGLVRIAAAGQGSRTTKYRHTAEEGLPATDDELAVIAVLLLRGPQTRGELRTRTERIHPFGSLEAVEETLDGLGRRGLVELLDREPGAREARYRHRLGHVDDPEVAAALRDAADEHRARLQAEGRLLVDEDDDPSDEDDDPAGTATRATDATSDRDALAPLAPADAPAAPTTPAPVGVPGHPTTGELLARIETLERRIDELEELVAS